MRAWEKILLSILTAVLAIAGACSGDDGHEEDVCTDRRCGQVGEVDCGTCAGENERCVPGGHCVDVCASRECGSVGDADCGSCPGPTDVCTSLGQCVDVCAGRQCGAVGRMDCGTCSGGRVCSTGGLCHQPGECPDGMVEIEGQGVCIDAYEYTTGQFVDFLQGFGNECPSQVGPTECFTHDVPMPDHPYPDIIYQDGDQWVVEPGYEGYPMAWVTWFAAREACGYEGKRLCRLREWVSACRGPDGLAYPYGNEFSPGACNGWNSTLGRSAEVAPVGSYPRCEGGYPGLFDMSGNVSEFVEDLYDVPGYECVYIMGGEYVITDPNRHLCQRTRFQYDLPPGITGAIGFRCCWTLE